MEREALEIALEALENSVDLVVEDAYNAEQLYGNYPTRQGKVGGLKVLAEQHKQAITAIKEALAQPAQAEVLAQAVPDETLTIVYQSGFYDGKKQQQLVDLTVGEWFDWWRVSQVANETEAEIDFADFLIIAQAVAAKLKEKNG